MTSPEDRPQASPAGSPGARRRKAATTLAVLALLWAVFVIAAIPREHTLDCHYRSNEGTYLVSTLMTYWKTTRAHMSALDLLRCGYIYAPLPFLLPQPLLWLGPASVAVLRSLSLFYLFGLLLAVHLLASRLFDRRWVGWGAAAMLVTFGSVYDFAWYFNQLFLVASLVALTLWALFSSDWMRRTRWCVAAGVFMGLALLSHRGSPLLMLSPPVALYGLIAWRMTRLWTAPLKTAMIFAIALPLALPHLYDYFVLSGHVVSASGAPTEGYVFDELTRGFTKPETLTYFRMLFDWQLTPGLGFVWVIAAVAMAATARRDPRRAVMLVAAILPMIWLGLFDTQNRDFAFPVVPLFAPMIAGSLTLLGRRWDRPAMAALAIAAAVWGLGLPTWREARMGPCVSPDPALSYSCRDALDALKSTEPGRATVLYNDGLEERFWYMTRDLLACVHLSRPDLPASMMHTNRPTEEGAALEVWIVRDDQPGRDEARALVERQLTLPPEAPAYVVEEPPRDIEPPERPPVGRPLPTRLFDGSRVWVYDAR